MLINGGSRGVVNEPGECLAGEASSDPFRTHLESLLIAFSSMIIGILTGAFNFLTDFNDLGLISSDGLQRGAAGGAAIIIVFVILLYHNKIWDDRMRVSKLAAKYLVLFAAGALAAALFSANYIYNGKEFQEWVQKYAYYTTKPLEIIIREQFFKSLISVFIFSFGSNYIIPKLNIKFGKRRAILEK